MLNGMKTGRQEDGKTDELAGESMFITCPFVKREA